MPLTAASSDEPYLDAVLHKGQVLDSRTLFTCVDLAERQGRSVCGRCEKALPKGRRSWCSDRCRRTFSRNHWWPRASSAALRRDKYACVRCGERRRLEVNHIEPIRGGPRTMSCLNHLDNLETLCHACHLIVTAQQFRPARAAMRAEAS
jgi:5-methylcytosine-specific restriction endonuclease McrA